MIKVIYKVVKNTWKYLEVITSFPNAKFGTSIRDYSFGVSSKVKSKNDRNISA